MEDLCRMCLKKCLSKKAVDSTVAAALDDIFHIKVCFLFIFLFHIYRNLIKTPKQTLGCKS